MCIALPQRSTCNSRTATKFNVPPRTFIIYLRIYNIFFWQQYMPRKGCCSAPLPARNTFERDTSIHVRMRARRRSVHRTPCIISYSSWYITRKSYITSHIAISYPTSVRACGHNSVSSDGSYIRSILHYLVTGTTYSYHSTTISR